MRPHEILKFKFTLGVFNDKEGHCLFWCCVVVGYFECFYTFHACGGNVGSVECIRLLDLR